MLYGGNRYVGKECDQRDIVRQVMRKQVSTNCIEREARAPLTQLNTSITNPPTSFYFFCGTLFNLVRTVREIANDQGLLAQSHCESRRRCRVPGERTMPARARSGMVPTAAERGKEGKGRNG